MTTSAVTDSGGHVGFFGGSFNPPHVGHVLLVSYVLATRPVAEVWLVPTWRHAFGKSLAPWEDRLEMCRRVATILGPRVKVSDVEGRIGGESRTVVTLRRLREEHAGRRFALLVGADVLAERHAWRGWDEISQMADVWAVGRRGGPPTGEPTVELPEVSSTDVRRRIATGDPVEHLVPRSVLEHIRQRGLYATLERDP